MKKLIVFCLFRVIEKQALLLFIVFSLLLLIPSPVSADETCLADGRYCGGTTECRYNFDPSTGTPTSSYCVCPGGLTCQNPTTSFDGSIGQTICGTNLRNWQCTGGGWIEQSSACTCSGGGTGCSSDAQCPSGQRCNINPMDGTGTCVISGGGGGTSGVGTITAPGTIPTVTGDPSTFVAGLVRNGILVMIIVAFIVALIWTMLAGLKFILANGEPKEVSAAWSQIRYGLIGLTVILSAFAIIKLVETFFNVNIIGGGLRLPTRTS